MHAHLIGTSDTMGGGVFAEVPLSEGPCRDFQLAWFDTLPSGLEVLHIREWLNLL